MNKYLGFCFKCGNPRNPGEMKCRFCGEAFDNITIEKKSESDQSETLIDSYDVNVSNEPGSDDNDAIIIEGVDEKNASIKDDDTVSSIQVDSTNSPFNGINGSDIKSKDSLQLENHNDDTLNPLTEANNKNYYKISKKNFWIWSSLLITVFLSVCCFFIYKCTQKDTPSDVVEKAFECLKNKDYDSFMGYMDLSNKSKQLMHDIFPKIMKWYAEDIDHLNIDSELIDDNEDSAIVTVIVFFNDGKQKKSEIKLNKIKDEWKIKPFGDYDSSIDSLLNLGRYLGIDLNVNSVDNILDVFSNFF